MTTSGGHSRSVDCGAPARFGVTVTQRGRAAPVLDRRVGLHPASSDLQGAHAASFRPGLPRLKCQVLTSGENSTVSRSPGLALAYTAIEVSSSMTWRADGTLRLLLDRTPTQRAPEASGQFAQRGLAIRFLSDGTRAPGGRHWQPCGTSIPPSRVPRPTSCWQDALADTALPVGATTRRRQPWHTSQPAPHSPPRTCVASHA